MPHPSSSLLPSHKPSRPAHNRKPSVSPRPLSGPTTDPFGPTKGHSRRVLVVVLSLLRRLQRSLSLWKVVWGVLGLLLWAGVSLGGGRGEVSSRVRIKRPVFTEVVVQLPPDTRAHQWRDKFGIVEVEDEVMDGRHVLLDVIERAENQWSQTLRAQPKTLADAHKAYKTSFLRRSPTLAYAKLFSLACPSSPPTATLSPIISALPMQMYLSSLGKTLRKRQYALERSNFTSPTGGGGRFVLVADQGEMRAEFPWGTRGEDETKAGTMTRLMQGVHDQVEGGLFDDFRVTVNLELDVPGHVLPYMLAEQKFDWARLTEFEDPNLGETWPLYTWHQTCEDFTPYRKKKYQKDLDAIAAAKLVPQRPTFITGQLAYSPCMFPELMELNPTLGSPPPIRDPAPVPRLSFAKVPLSFEVLVPNLFPAQPRGKTQKSHPTAWKDKDDSTGIVWRGAAPRFPPPPPPRNDTSDDDASRPGSGQRMQKKTKATALTTEHETATATGAWKESLVFTGPPKEEDGEISFFTPANASLATAYRLLRLDKTPIPLDFPPTIKANPRVNESLIEPGPRFDPSRWRTDRLVDAKLARGEKVVCDLEMDGCRQLIRDVEVDQDDGYEVGKHKFVFVLEGEDPTEHMRAGSLVFQASMLESTWHTQAVPWVHYIPVQPALYNLPSIVAFLRAHDAVAAKIASNGKRFADELLGERQRVLGVAGVLVEYARLWSKKRTDMTWELPPTSSP